MLLWVTLGGAMARLASILTAGALAALGASGCTGELTDDHVDAIRGQLGAVEFSGAPEIRAMHLDRSELRLDLRLRDATEGWAVMVGLTIPRNARAETEGAGVISLDAPNAHMIGCSGVSDGDWDFDCEPDDLDVRVSPLGHIRFVGTFTSETCEAVPEDEPERVSGEVDLI
jgi:hypothetical protein